MDLFDIAGAATGAWTAAVVYGGSGMTFTTGTTVTPDPYTGGGRFSFINASGLQRCLKFDVKNRVLSPAYYLRYPSGTAAVGQRMSTAMFVDGATKLVFILLQRMGGRGVLRDGRPEVSPCPSSCCSAARRSMPSRVWRSARASAPLVWRSSGAWPVPPAAKEPPPGGWRASSRWLAWLLAAGPSPARSGWPAPCWLAGDEISTSEWLLEEGALLEQVVASNTTSKTTVWLRGGQAGTIYLVTNRIVTVGGRRTTGPSPSRSRSTRSSTTSTGTASRSGRRRRRPAARSGTSRSG